MFKHYENTKTKREKTAARFSWVIDTNFPLNHSKPANSLVSILKLFFLFLFRSHSLSVYLLGTIHKYFEPDNGLFSLVCLACISTNTHMTKCARCDCVRAFGIVATVVVINVVVVFTLQMWTWIFWNRLEIGFVSISVLFYFYCSTAVAIFNQLNLNDIFCHLLLLVSSLQFDKIHNGASRVHCACVRRS